MEQVEKAAGHPCRQEEANCRNAGGSSGNDSIAMRTDSSNLCAGFDLDGVRVYPDWR